MMLKTNSLGQFEIVGDAPSDLVVATLISEAAHKGRQKQISLSPTTPIRSTLLTYLREWPYLRYDLNTKVVAPPSDILHITKSGDIFFGAIRKLLKRYPNLDGFHPADPYTIERMIGNMIYVSTHAREAISQFLTLKAIRANALRFNQMIDEKRF